MTDNILNLTDIMANMNLEPQMTSDYGYATDDDYLKYELHSLSANAAICQIENFLHYFETTEQTLQTHALRTYLQQFDLSKNPIEKLFCIRQNSLNNAFICEEWDTIKCFLRLMTTSAIPIYVTDDDRNPCACCDGFSTTTIKYDNITIKETISATRYADNYTAGHSYSINVNYHQLKLILSGDVETNPGPTSHSKFCDEEKDKMQRKRINEMQKEIQRLKKAQEKQNNFLQRQLELEKRNRKKNRIMKGHRYAESLFTFANNAGTVAEDLATGVGPTINMAQKALQAMIDVGDQIKELFGIPGDYDLIGILISLISVGQALISKQLLSVTMHCVQLARQLGLTLSKLMSLVNHSEEIIIDDDVTQGIYYKAETVDDDIEPIYVAQSSITDFLKTAKDNPQLLPFTSFLTFICGIFAFLCSGSCPSPSDMTKHFASVGRASQGFKAVRDMFGWLSDYLSEIYYTTVYGISADEFKFMQHFPQLENIYAASKIISTIEKKIVDSSAAIANQILSIDHQLNEYMYKANRMNSSPNSKLVSGLQRTIKEQVEWASHSPARTHTIRTQPVAFYLFGHPGVGKSVLTETLKARIFKHYLRDKGVKYESCSFPRRAKNEYWEGYTNQPIVILDDFGNVKDSQMKPVEEYEELEYMVNTAQFPLKMAELKSKGVSNFTSEFIIASSNAKYPEIKHLTDPGAVFRRFHVWAEVLINPLYGVPTGRDSAGNPYYEYNPEAIAKLKGVSVDEIEPLMTEHYILNLYRVIHNKQSGNAEIHLVDGQQGITFDDYWKYLVKENDRRKASGKRLADAIRKEAGITCAEAPVDEQIIMDRFDRIFNPSKFMEALADTEYDVDLIDVTENKKEKTEEEINMPVDQKVVDELNPFKKDEIFSDAEEDSMFNALSYFSMVKDKLATIKNAFSKFKTHCHNKISTSMSRLKQCGALLKTTLFKVAQFILSFFQSAANKCYEYLPSVPTAKILSGICATVVAVFGVWYTGLFRSQPSNNCDGWCKFTRSPSDSDVPCSECPACKILEFPKTGNMLTHFLERTGVKSIRKDLCALGMSSEDLEDIREEIRTCKIVPRAQALIGKCKIQHFIDTDFRATTCQDSIQVLSGMCWYCCSLCAKIGPVTFDCTNPQEMIDQANFILDKIRSTCLSSPTISKLSPSFAQRVYEHQPTVPRPRTFAQRVYETQPQKPQQQRYAEGFVDCVTEMHIGARKYAQRDRVQIEQTTQVLLNNSVWIQAVDKNGMASRSNGVFLVGRTMLTTAHTILYPPHKDPVEHLIIRNPYATTDAIKVPISECHVSQIFQLDGSPVDLVLVSFPPIVPSRPKILSKFLDARDIDLLKEGDLTFSGFYEVKGKTIVQEKYPAYFNVSTKTTEYYLHKKGTCPVSENCKCAIQIGNHIDYDLETASGMCGALLSISNRMIHTKLIGFHVAGGAGALALGALTTKQLLEKALEDHVQKFSIPTSYLIDGRIPYSQSLVDPKKKSSLVDVGDCLSIGIAPSPAAPSITQLQPSLVFDKIQTHVTKPAYLRPVEIEGEKVDPMTKGLKKIMGGQVWVDPNLLNAAANDVFQGLGSPKSGKGIVHTYEEAICGVEGDSYKRPINRTTSPGYPYNLNNKSKGKTAWLGNDETYIVDHPELKQDVQNLLEKAKDGIRGDAISIATLKDEKRPIPKVEAGKTRVFEACPQHLVIAIRQYFLDFTAHVMRNRIDNGIAVGINPYSLEWTKLAHHLQSQGNNMIAGDFSNFDGSLLMQILVKICEKINEWYGDNSENQLIRSVLWEHICNADILVRGEVIRKTHSQPSGNPLTVIINSLFNGIVMRIAYLMLKKEQGLPMVCDYRKNVAEIIYGDDDIKSVNVKILDWFNQLTITDALASFGLTYTDETKTGIIQPYKTLEQVAFLKRKFVLQHDGTFLAPMDLENVLEITNWIKGKAKKTATLENCEQSIMELSLHDQSTYEYWSTRIKTALHEVGINIIIPTYYEQMELYLYNRDAYARIEYVPLW